MNLLDMFEGREPHQQAIDRLEQARIDHLKEKMDYYSKHHMVKDFQKAKAEHDSYFKVQDECMGYGTLVGEAANPAQQAAIAKKKEQGVAEGGYNDYDNNRKGFGRDENLRNRERNAGLETEQNNIQISINDRPWKVVPGRGYADSREEREYFNNMRRWAEKKSATSGKKWTVSLTGANPTVNEFAPARGGGKGENYFQALASAWYNGAFDTGSLQKGIKSKEDVERLLQRGILGPDGVTRKYGIDYNSDFDGVVISSDDYYEHSDYNNQGQEVDSRTGQKWGPYDYMEFSDEQLDESAQWRDPKYKNKLYTQEPPDYMDTREYDRAMWDPKPEGYPGRKELAGGGEYNQTDPLVRGAGIGRSGIKHNILDRGKRKGLPSRDQITSLKQSIRDVHGQHTRAKLPKQGDLTELSTDKLAQYKTAAGADARDADRAGNYKRGDKRFSGIVKATKKQFDNDLKKHGQQGVEEAGILRFLQTEHPKVRKTTPLSVMRQEFEKEKPTPVPNVIQNKDANEKNAREIHRKYAYESVAEGSSNAVERAILNRIMVAHTDLLMKFGPDKVMQAAEEVAYDVGDVDEIGTSDVSAYVNQVRRILGAE